MPPKRGRGNAANEERILEAAIQREAVAAVKARWPGILIQGSMNGAHLAGGGRAWNMLALGGVTRDEADLHFIERGRNGEASLYVEMKVPGKWPTTKQAYRGACVARRGNVYAVAHSSEELLKIVEDYLPVDFIADNPTPPGSPSPAPPRQPPSSSTPTRQSRSRKARMPTPPHPCVISLDSSDEEDGAGAHCASGSVGAGSSGTGGGLTGWAAAIAAASADEAGGAGEEEEEEWHDWDEEGERYFWEGSYHGWNRGGFDSDEDQ